MYNNSVNVRNLSRSLHAKIGWRTLLNRRNKAAAEFSYNGETMSGAATTVRPAEASDSAAMAAIYNHYVEHTIITFEEDPVVAAEMAVRLHEVRSAVLPWVVAEERDELVGYAYAHPWKTRAAYRFAVEITVYVAKDHTGRGIGSLLYGHLFPILQTRGIHAVIGGIALPNAASVALHEKFGLKRVAQFPEVGFKFNRWIDVGYWQRTM